MCCAWVRAVQSTDSIEDELEGESLGCAVARLYSSWLRACDHVLAGS